MRVGGRSLAVLVSMSTIGSGCASHPAAVRVETAGKCADVSWCQVAGDLQMSSDGHGYIGVLKLSDGSCINVSLPEKESRLLMGKPSQRRLLTGKVLPYPFGEDLFFKVNGRRVGFGNCQRYYLFIK